MLNPQTMKIAGVASLVTPTQKAEDYVENVITTPDVQFYVLLTGKSTTTVRFVFLLGHRRRC